jgi:predicted nucleic acid-binding Zn ribbon protein
MTGRRDVRRPHSVGPATPAPPARTGDGPIRLSDALGSVAERIGLGNGDIVTAVFARWEELVGETVASHVQPVQLRGTTLVLQADHPAWATQMHHLAPDILRRLAEQCGTGPAPDRLHVKVRGRPVDHGGGS